MMLALVGITIWVTGGTALAIVLGKCFALADRKSEYERMLKAAEAAAAEATAREFVDRNIAELEKQFTGRQS
jgi:hypothetical protein